MNNIVVFASGKGSNFQALVNAVASGEIPARIRGVITDNARAGVIERAQRYAIPYAVLSPASFASEKEYHASLLSQLRQWYPALIVLAGYLKRIPESIVQTYENRIINIHPSLLPKYGGKGYYGMHVHRAVLENGENETGCTVHVVTAEYDEGPVLAQMKVPVQDDDTAESLARRVQQAEMKLLPHVVSKMLTQNPENTP